MFYQDKPLFGLDIGHSTIKVMQIDSRPGKVPRVVGYGAGKYSPQAISSGVITDFKSINDSLYELFDKNLVGAVTTHRVACTIPTSRTFSRPMKLPPLNDGEIADAVSLEVEQYIPIPRANLYVDYEILSRNDEGTELLMMAIPKEIVDSYMKLLTAVGLEPVAMEPTMNAAARLFGAADPSHTAPSILLDFGSVAVDAAVFDQTMFVNTTISGGSDTITELIAKGLGISTQEAYVLKNKFGISYSEQQADIKKAINPLLQNLVREMQKLARYYNDRAAAVHHEIAQVITIGGGANMPGLSEYLSSELKLPTRMLDPWHQIDFGELPPPSELDRSMYITVAGESLLNPKEIFHD